MSRNGELLRPDVEGQGRLARCCGKLIAMKQRRAKPNAWPMYRVHRIHRSIDHTIAAIPNGTTAGLRSESFRFQETAHCLFRFVLADGQSVACRTIDERF